MENYERNTEASLGKVYFLVRFSLILVYYHSTVLCSTVYEARTSIPMWSQRNLYYIH